MVTKEVDRTAINKVLDESLSEDDFYCRKSRHLLTSMGLETDTVLMLLAQHKSSVKYGYDLSSESLSHLLELAEAKDREAPLKRLIESPFFFVKACWLYEHAPYFYFCDKGKSEDRDSLIIDFAKQYDTHFLKNRVDIDTWEEVENPKRIRVTTFWESKILDPLSLIERAKNDKIEGLELSIDFHPFNYTRLLPEELSHERREKIREACLKSNIKIDIHSPIIGPYTPSPDPSKGRQRFFDPTQCSELMYETIELAKDIGAGCVVVHLIDTSNLKGLVDLIEQAAGSNVRVTIENYPRRKKPQTSDVFIECVHEILNALSREVREKNFGITLDVGHLNIEGEDPLVASARIGNWCLDNHLYFRVHATDNYGNLLYSPPAYSADVHGNVSGRGINNALIIRLLRSMGHQFDVVAEQIQPLTPEDIATIHGAQSCPIDKPYETFVKTGKERLSRAKLGAFIQPEVVKEDAYQFLAGMENVDALREYLVYRRIQDKKHLSVDEARRISQDFMKMPQKIKPDLTAYIDDLLLPIQSETGVIQKSELDLICQNISGALFATISNQHLNRIFSQDIIYQKGDIICEQGTPGQEMYLVKEGEVTVFINESSVASLGPGEIFGEISLFYNVDRSATVKAAKKGTKIGVLSREGLENLFRYNQPYAHDLIYRLYKILPERLRNINDKYKTAIPALHLIFDGDKREMPSLDDIKMEAKEKKVDFFPALSEDEVRRICQEVKVFDPEQIIFAEGDKGDAAYFIMEGKVKVVVASQDLKEILLGELGEGEIFGEMALIDEKPRSASVVTLTPCKMAYISNKAFNDFIETRSETAFRLMGFICLSLFGHVLRLDRLYSDVKNKIKAS
jgi:CRP-like cAMP-binding protein/sugar phosphate isomerase/epimerase/polyhydroxyalkanoate synthesis regulator phasin